MDFKEEMRRQGSSQPFITGAIDEIHMSQLLDKCMIDLEQLTAVERLVGESQKTAEYPKAVSQVGSPLSDPRDSFSYASSTSHKDDQLAKFASFFKQQIEDAIEPLLGPVAFVFQNRWEAERKRRQNVLALEEKKLVLRRKKIQRVKTWHRGGRYRRSARRASSTKSSRLTTRQGASTEVSSDEVKLCCN
ncbi:hypothetical protein M758_6G060900 [Ceratodon purpureus]|nr:hypothetical protein M758_6G060900 [Ceratodon purpureus]